MGEAGLAEVALPDFGMPEREPVIPAATYEARIAAARERARARGFDALVIYADREHSATLAYLTGFDPRFEEAILILGAQPQPALLLGNECYGYADISPVRLRKRLFQSLSLPSQPRDRSKPLAELLAEEGIGRGNRVGVVGWKYFTPRDTPTPDLWMDAPSYLVDVLRGLVGDPARVLNATEIFLDAQDGLRVTNDVDQLAWFEYAACHTSTAVRNVLFGLRPGMTEHEAVQLMRLNGMPLSCHLMLSSGARASFGLGSPSTRRIERGDRFTTAFGVWGGLNCRAGFVVESAEELPPGIRDYVGKLVTPYFRAIAEWYAAIGIGVEGRALYEVIRNRLGDPFFGVSLNPGHQLHLDEWVNSPIYEGSTAKLRSGMALQVDVIPATGTEYFTTNIEDGIALADEPLRREFEESYPDAWRRIQARRKFMREALGIELKPEVLPFSNIPAYLAPFLLRPTQVMTVAA